MNKSTFSVYVEIDALMDFRYGKLLENYSDMDTDMILKFANYKERDSDNFSNLFSSFNADVYAKQTITASVLAKSPITEVPILIRRCYDAHIRHPSIEESRLKICINFKDLPYGEEAKNAIAAAVSNFYYENWAVSVSHISVPDKKLTPKYLRNKYDLAIVYDLDAFIAHHAPKSKDVFRGLAFYSFLNLVNGKEAFLDAYERINANEVEPALALTEHISWIIEAYFEPLAVASARTIFVPDCAHG